MKNETLFTELKDKATRDRAFSHLVQEYQQRLYWHIRRMVLNHDDADDVLQNTFIKVYRNIENFRGDSAVYSWMYRIATNEALNFLKKQANRYRVTNEELRERMVNNLVADTYFEGGEIELQLQKALATLPEKQLLVFNMRYYQDMKYEDMSEILDTSVGALKASYHHAVKKLQHYLKENA
ncbi:sigma-70 family RNA polymerase sigma factor [Robertkochia marina]|uniref:Sigma-70 family RNA polymerase sigma factor n=1 Tax=Robertkochia marina TaxID=1227945 RepID=A0A4S3M085_9FLAO|nr:sigma-70 family RNA polymerase sigma factor [Robertkochia marina]THD67447.1 sigma-70 family RNA polymerase sigma factor [Robertkochia marina]TRZ44683.1 sigma-70 family RNA polymerase sigma factor [Robertkochia marina]